NLFQVEFLSADPMNLPATPLATRLAEAVFEGGGLFAVALRVADLAAALKELGGRGVVPRSQGELKEDGQAVGGGALRGEAGRGGGGGHEPAGGPAQPDPEAPPRRPEQGRAAGARVPAQAPGPPGRHHPRPGGADALLGRRAGRAGGRRGADADAGDPTTADR